MAGRTRTTKKLAQRLNREYFKHLFPIPRWRRLLSYGLIAAGVLWLGWHAVARNQNVYNAGPIASAHAMFSLNCSACHVQRAVFSKTVTDQACSQCHDGPVHQAQQTYTPACTECHLEHKGIARLAHTSEKACTECHSDLKTKNGEKPKVEAKIASFSANSGHPEFTPLRPGQSDPGTVKFNHNTHLKAPIRGPKGNVELKCVDCHRPGGSVQEWPYGHTVPLADNPNNVAMAAALTDQSNTHAHVSQRAYMGPVDYYEHCADCHTLVYDSSISEPAPHDKPDKVRAFVIAKLKEYIAAHPDAIRSTNTLVAQIPGRKPMPPPRNAAEWVSQHTTDAELLLWHKGCKECHSLIYPSETALPEVPKANVTVRWMKKGEFDHAAHQMLQCVACHSKANNSKETSDVLLPGIETCRECHSPNKSQAAQSDCFECHIYHDWKKEKHIDGKYTVRQLITGVNPPPGKKTANP